MIEKIKGKYTVMSEHTGRVFGRYATLTEAKKRLRQIEFFKHRKKRPLWGANGALHGVRQDRRGSPS